MKTGTQVIYVPPHARGDINHLDCYRGFIANDKRLGRAVNVLFWQSDAIGVTLLTESPWATDLAYLVAVDSCEQSVVDGLVGRG